MNRYVHAIRPDPDIDRMFAMLALAEQCDGRAAFEAAVAERWSMTPDAILWAAAAAMQRMAKDAEQRLSDHGPARRRL